MLWSELYRLGIHVQFAHRTFSWSSEARGKAAVHCVIVGFGEHDVYPKRLFDYADLKGEPHELSAANINAYLVDAPDVTLPNRREPICAVPAIAFGSMPNDGGNLLMSDRERGELLGTEPAAAKWIRRFLGAEEFINGVRRWCLWLKDIRPAELRALPAVAARVAAVRICREASNRATTRELAAYPSLFGEIRQPATRYIAIPKTSSERRTFIPMGLLERTTIASTELFTVANATPFHFGILTSTMHMAWVRAVCGRLESRYRYSAGIVYNNFPWPQLPDISTVRTERSRPQAGEVEVQAGCPSTPAADAANAQGERLSKHRAAIEAAAQGVLDARAQFPDATLADLYDPLSMPPALVKAHQSLDRAVDAAYIAAEKAEGRKPPRLTSDAERVAFLFERYQALTSLLPAAKPKRTRMFAERRRITLQGQDFPA